MGRNKGKKGCNWSTIVNVPRLNVHQTTSKKQKRKKKKKQQLKAFHDELETSALLCEPIEFNVLRERKRLPQAQLNHSKSEEGLSYLREFIGRYLEVYDSRNRQGLLEFYADSAIFCLQFSRAVVHLGQVVKNNRGARSDQQYEVAAVNVISQGTNWVGQRRRKKTTRLQQATTIDRRKVGRLQVVALLDSLPRSRHVKDETFHLDVITESSSAIVFSINGVFAEDGGTQQDHARSGSHDTDSLTVMRQFHRTIVLLPPPHNKIQHDALLIIPSYETGHKICQSSGDNLAQSQLAKLHLDSNSQPSAPQEQQQAFVERLSAQTGMNQHYSRLCLEEYAWDWDNAVQAAVRLKSCGMIPAGAFLDSM